MSATVVILTKLPGHLPIKTRLVPLLGEATATRFYVEMLEATVELARRIDPDPVLAFSPPDADPHAALPSLSNCSFRPVEGADGATCLENALDEAFAGRPLLALGGDAPDLPYDLLVEVVRGCGIHDAVFVPTDDGGFSCLGLRRPVPGLAGGFRYGSGDSLDALERFFEGRGLSVHRTDPWPDIDTPADYRAYLARRNR